MRKHVYVLSFMLLPLLSGCVGDRLDQRYKLAETPTVILKNDEVCFEISSSADYQPAFISFAPRHTPPQKQWYQQYPRLSVANGLLCVPSRLYTFSENKEYLVTFILASKEMRKTTEYNTRRFNSAFEIRDHRAIPIQVKGNEF
ncbi:hypothetical protein SM017_003575 [Cronobacter turicensis]|nr:hypothetical protein [Cronobacter turicensis]